MTQVLPLRQGDLVRLVAPGSALPREIVESIAAHLQSMGYRVHIPSGLFGPKGLVSHSVDQRVRHLKEAFEDQATRAVWCLRGGYGSIQLLPELKKLKRPPHMPLFLGYSDITSLFIWLRQNWQVPVFHSPLAEALVSQKTALRDVKEVLSVISGKQRSLQFRVRPLNSVTLAGDFKMVGGNLEVVASTLGTPYQIKTDSRTAVFFEEVGERAYRIDRKLRQMEQAGVFKKCKAVFFGSFVDCAEPSGKDLSTQILKEFAGRIKIPVFAGLQVGHGSRNRLLPFGTQCVYQKGLLQIQSGVKAP